MYGLDIYFSGGLGEDGKDEYASETPTSLAADDCVRARRFGHLNSTNATTDEAPHAHMRTEYCALLPSLTSHTFGTALAQRGPA